MTDEKKTCSGFPQTSGVCSQPATAIVMRLPVCDAHKKEAEAKGLRAHSLEKTK